MSRPRTIWHVVPAHVLARESQGSFKDVSARVAALQAAGGSYRRIVVSDDLPEAVLAHLAEGEPTHVFVEYSTCPRIVEALRAGLPGVVLAVRAHNIEPMQNLDNHGLRNLRIAPWVLYGAARLLAGDIRCRRAADVIYAISPWEAEVYWKRLPGAARVAWLPYVTPEALIPARAATAAARGTIACLPTSQRNRKSLDLVNRFLEFAVGAHPLGGGFSFALTGDLAPWRLELPAAVTATGMLPDLKDFMAGVRAVAILSPLGYGFKTTIMDAIAAGAFALVHPRLYRRCPAELRPACIPVEGRGPRAIARALSALEAPFPLPGINEVLRERASVMLEAFLGQPNRGGKTADCGMLPP